MRILVTDHVAESTEQTRAYAEYRVFSSLASYSHLIGRVEVSLASTNGHAGRLVCEVAVRLKSRRQARVAARGGHAYDAINRAAERVGELLRRHAAAVQSR